LTVFNFSLVSVCEVRGIGEVRAIFGLIFRWILDAIQSLLWDHNRGTLTAPILEQFSATKSAYHDRAPPPPVSLYKSLLPSFILDWRTCCSNLEPEADLVPHSEPIKNHSLLLSRPIVLLRGFHEALERDFADWFIFSDQTVVSKRRSGDLYGHGLRIGETIHHQFHRLDH
jgi:hypothetical protein